MHMHNTNATTGRKTNELLSQLHHLLDAHHDALGEKTFDTEREWLSEWVAHPHTDQTAESRTLDERAFAMLLAIEDKLAESASEELRMQAESPQTSVIAEQHVAQMRDTRKEVAAILDNLKKTTRQ